MGAQRLNGSSGCMGAQRLNEISDSDTYGSSETVWEPRD